MIYLNLGGDKDSLFSYLRDFNGKMSLLLTAMLARDYLRKYANIREMTRGTTTSTTM